MALLSIDPPADLYRPAFDGLAAADSGVLAAALEDARSRDPGAPGRIVATLLTRTDLSPRRVELLGVAWREEAEALARQQVEGGARLTPDESARRVELGLLHGNAALVLRACGPSWPKGAVPAVVAWSLIRVVAEAADQVGYIAGRRLHHGRNGEHAAGSVSTAPRGAPPLKTGASTTMLLP